MRCNAYHVRDLLLLGDSRRMLCVPVARMLCELFSGADCSLNVDARCGPFSRSELAYCWCFATASMLTVLACMLSQSFPENCGTWQSSRSQVCNIRVESTLCYCKKRNVRQCSRNAPCLCEMTSIPIVVVWSATCRTPLPPTHVLSHIVRRVSSRSSS
jgi:hypothetical protein